MSDLDRPIPNPEEATYPTSAAAMRGTMVIAWNSSEQSQTALLHLWSWRYVEIWYFWMQNLRAFLQVIGKWTPSGTGIHQTGTKRTECPFDVLIQSNDWGWDLKVRCGNHNHAPSLGATAHQVTGSGIFRRMPARQYSNWHGLALSQGESQQLCSRRIRQPSSHGPIYITSVPRLVENI